MAPFHSFAIFIFLVSSTRFFACSFLSIFIISSVQGSKCRHLAVMKSENDHSCRLTNLHDSAKVSDMITYF